MDPVRPTEIEGFELVNYRGAGDVGDLYVWRPEPGQIISLWRFTEDELLVIANQGGVVAITTHTEPIPPMSVQVIDETYADPQPNRFRNAPELDDPERQPDAGTCRECGCTDQRACVIVNDQGRIVTRCAWANPTLCTACTTGADPRWKHPPR